MENDASKSETAPDTAPMRRTGVPTMAGLSGAALALMGVAIYIMVTSGERLPDLSRERFDAAYDLWKASAPENYDIEITVDGRQPSVYRVQMRGGEVHSATRNGNPLTQRRTMGTWSVPGMFDTVERDLVTTESALQGDVVARSRPLVLRSQFHAEFGYPEKYSRIELGTQHDTSWEVTAFLPVE